MRLSQFIFIEPFSNTGRTSVPELEKSNFQSFGKETNKMF